MASTYTVTSKAKQLQIVLTPTVYNPSNHNFTLSFNRRTSGGSEAITKTATPDSTTGLVTFLIPCKSYNVGDVLSGFRLTWNSGTGVIGRVDGVTFLIDGEEMATQKSNTYTTSWNKVGEHTIQAVYRGNNSYKAQKTVKKTFYVKQDDDGSQSTIYKLTFLDLQNDTFKYKDGSVIRVKLTQGGNPLDAKTITLSSSRGYTTTATTSTDGIATLSLGNLQVGTHELNVVYEEDNTIQTSNQRTINVTKNNAIITHAHDEGKDHYDKGDWIVIRWQEPDDAPLNDRYLPVYINGRAYICETNNNGRTWIQFSNSGTFRFKVVYEGDSNLEYTESEFTITAN